MAREPQVLQLTQVFIKQHIEFMDEQVWPLIEKLNPDAKKATKADAPAIAEFVRQMYPEQEWVYPDGTVVRGTAWGLALKEFAKAEEGMPHITNADEMIGLMERGLD